MLLQSAQARADLAIAPINPTLEVLPEALHRVQLGTVGGQPHQDDVLQYLHALPHMRRGLVQQDAMETLGVVLAKLPQKDREAVGIAAGQLSPEGVARRGLHGGIQPGVLIEWRNDLDRLDSIPGETTADRQGETKPAFVLAADPHGLCRGLPASGRDGPEAARALCDNVRRLSTVFFAWLGRGRLRLAWSW
jgi:hypothetical protein